jgi:uncharacterized membrane protein
MHEFLVKLIEYIVPVTELLGVAVVTWGSVHGLALLGLRARDMLMRRPFPHSLRDIRIAIGEKMALGLDFFLAGDIIGTIVVPSRESLLLLGGIVIIRTVIGTMTALVH